MLLDLFVVALQELAENECNVVVRDRVRVSDLVHDLVQNHLAQLQAGELEQVLGRRREQQVRNKK